MADIVIRNGDRLPVLQRSLTLDGEPVALTGATVIFKAANDSGEVISGTCDITDSDYGQVEYPWSTNDALVPNGFYRAWFEITYSGGERLTSPNDGYLVLHITTALKGTFTYSGSPSTGGKDTVRFYLQDLDSNDPLLSDEEIQFIVDTWYPSWGSYVYCAAIAADIISAKFAREISYSADGVSIGAQELQTKYETLASNLRDVYKNELIVGGPDVGGIMWGEQYDPSLMPLSFWRGMHDNNRAGQQDYGGMVRPPDPWVEGTYGR